MNRIRTGDLEGCGSFRKQTHKTVVSMTCSTLYSTSELSPFAFLIKDLRDATSVEAAFIGGICYPTKGCAGIEPATTQRVSPRLLPSAFVRTDRVSSYRTNFNLIEFPYASFVLNRRGRIRTSEAFRVTSGL